MRALFDYLIFPGFLFSLTAGLFAGWVDRKVTARLQWRKGPPWHQNFTDIIKLLGKEIIVPQGGKTTFVLAPCFGLLSAVLVAVLLGKSILFPGQGFVGDLIVILYLLVIPPLASILGAFASRNPLAAVGASREIKLILAYELPFLLSIIAVIIKSAGALQIGALINHQLSYGSHVASWSGALAFVVCLLCMQAKLGVVPFDVSEAEQEIMAGVLIEYSGPILAIFKMTKAVLLYAVPLFLIVLFLGNDLSAPVLFGKYLLLLLGIILMKNTNPRLRIDQILRFFWRIPLLLAVAAVVLAVFGL